MGNPISRLRRHENSESHQQVGIGISEWADLHIKMKRLVASNVVGITYPDGSPLDVGLFDVVA